MTIETIVAVQPSNSNSLTYGFLQTRRMKPGKARESMTSIPVAQYVLITLTRKDVRNVRMMMLSRSLNDAASGVAILSIN